MPLTDKRGKKSRVESIPLTNMRMINGWVESIILRLNGGGFSFWRAEMVLHGFYVIKDSFFEKVNDPYLKSNKNGNRPFYYCLQDQSDEELFWMIPLSSRVDKYKAIIQKKKAAHKPCDGLYVCKLPSGNDSVFLIQDIFPVKEEYIEREYTLGGNHLILPYEKDIAAINKKAKKVRLLIRRNIRLTPTSPDVLRIIECLKN